MDVLVCVMRSLLDDSSDQRVRDKAVGVLIYVILEVTSCRLRYGAHLAFLMICGSYSDF